MITGSPKLDKFIVEPGMKLKPFDENLIKKIQPNHPYKILLWILYKYNSSYNNWRENDANPNKDGYNDDVIDLYFNMLDDFNRYGIAFQREYELFPDNKLLVFENKRYGKSYFSLVGSKYNLKTLLFNKVKTIYLNKHDRGEKPLTKEEKLKRNLIKKLTNKKQQVVLMDPDIYDSLELFKLIIKDPYWHIKKFNNRIKYYGIEDFLRIEFD